MSKKDLYLQKKGNVYWYVRRLPKCLREADPSYENKQILWVSTGETSLVRARQQRDMLNAKLTLELLALEKYGSGEPARQRFLLELLKSDALTREGSLVEMQDYDGNYEYETDSILNDFDLDHLEENDPVLLSAILDAVNLAKTGKKSSYTLKDALNDYLEDNESLAYRTKLKIKAAVRDFLSVISAEDMDVEKIKKHFIREKYIAPAKIIHSASKINETISSLSRIVGHAISSERVDEYLRNPFSGFKKLAENAIQFQMFSERQMHLLCKEVESLESLNQRDSECLLALKLIWATGARREEICSLGTEDIKKEASKGGWYLKIMKGKNKSALRDIPVHSTIEADVAQQRDYARSVKSELFFTTFSTKRLDDKNGEYLGKWFKKLRDKALGAGMTSRESLHSLRRHVATELERAGVPEETAVWILGHERKYSMTYGHYSNGPAMLRLRDIINALPALDSKNYSPADVTPE